MTTDGSHWPEKEKPRVEKSPLEDALDKFGGTISWSPTESLDDFLKRYDATRKREMGMTTKNASPDKP